MLTISDEQRQILDENGVLLPLLDEEGKCYMVMPIKFTTDSLLTQAYIPSIAAYGEGETREDAVLALQEALRNYTEACGREQSF